MDGDSANATMQFLGEVTRLKEASALHSQGGVSQRGNAPLADDIIIMAGQSGGALNDPPARCTDPYTHGRDRNVKCNRTASCRRSAPPTRSPPKLMPLKQFWKYSAPVWPREELTQ